VLTIVGSNKPGAAEGDGEEDSPISVFARRAAGWRAYRTKAAEANSKELATPINIRERGRVTGS
jgi:hypothetical protein